MVDLQCQGLSKCVDAVRGARKELLSEIAGVESPRMALDAAQARLLGKLMRDPTALGDRPREGSIPSRSGRGDELGGREVVEGLWATVGQC